MREPYGHASTARIRGSILTARPRRQTMITTPGGCSPGLDGKLYENQSGTLMRDVPVWRDFNRRFLLFGKGSIDTDGYGFGGTLTWLGQNGFYVDGQTQLNWYDSDITSDTLGQSCPCNWFVGSTRRLCCPRAVSIWQTPRTRAVSNNYARFKLKAIPVCPEIQDDILDRLRVFDK